MGFLQTSMAALDALVDNHLAALDEFDLVSGTYQPIIGKAITPYGRLEACKIHLTPKMTVGHFSMSGEGVDKRLVSEALSLLYQRNWTAALLESALRPLDPESSSEEFYNEIAERVLEGTRSRYVIIRDLVHGDDASFLKCRAVRDRGTVLQEVDHERYDLSKDAASSDVYQTALNQFESSKVYLTFLHKRELPSLFSTMNDIPGTSKIQTIAIAILSVSDKVKGFINIGYDYPLYLNDYLESTMATSFNHMAVAIENHETLNRMTGLRRTEVNEFMQRSNVQFIQGFRHMAQSALVEADDAHHRMGKYYNFKGTADNPSDQLVAAHRDIERAFSRMASLKSLRTSLERADLIEVFDDAKDWVRHQANNAGVAIRVHKLSAGPMDAKINVEAMHHVFGNLLLNSIEAFVEANSKNTDRRITVSFRKDAGAIMIDLADDGPGVRLGRGILSVDDIWLPEKTTKKKGTGYGLPFVRMIIQDIHRGSINLRRSAKGALFRITFPADLTTQ